MTTQNTKLLTVNSSEFKFLSCNIGFNLYGTVINLECVLINSEILKWHSDSEFLATCIHEITETITISTIANILDEMQIYNTDLSKYPKFFECLRNVSHFMTAYSLGEYLYLSHNKPFSQYVSFDRLARLDSRKSLWLKHYCFNKTW